MKMEWKIWVWCRGKYEEKTKEIYRAEEKYGVWIQECSRNFYLCTGHGYYMTYDFVMKKTWIPFQENVCIFICEEETGLCIYKMFFKKQNSKRQPSYEYYIELKKEKMVYIGGTVFCQIRMQELSLEGGWMRLQWKQGEFLASGNMWNMYRNGSFFQNETKINKHDFLEIAGQMFYFKEEKGYRSKQ